MTVPAAITAPTPRAAGAPAAACAVPAAQSCSNTSITSLATGAANAAPYPGTPLSVTAIATVGSAAGAKAMNHTLLSAVPISVSAVPVLPAACTPGICAGVPVPSLTTASIIDAIAAAVV